MIFVDTSALVASLDLGDVNHDNAVRVWHELLELGESVLTSNYVLLETVALVARRLGLQAVGEFGLNLVPILQLHWVDRTLHDEAFAAFLTAKRRNLSLVDCVSFAIMRRLAISSVFAFDNHFREQGFRIVPALT